jgi:hypothetical protein
MLLNRSSAPEVGLELGLVLEEVLPQPFNTWGEGWVKDGLGLGLGLEVV